MFYSNTECKQKSHWRVKAYRPKAAMKRWLQRGRPAGESGGDFRGFDKLVVHDGDCAASAFVPSVTWWQVHRVAGEEAPGLGTGALGLSLLSISQKPGYLLLGCPSTILIKELTGVKVSEAKASETERTQADLRCGVKKTEGTVELDVLNIMNSFAQSPAEATRSEVKAKPRALPSNLQGVGT